MSYRENQINKIKNEFLFNGFLYSPLDNNQILMCLDNGLKDYIYSMGCDMNSGYKFNSLFNEHYKEKDYNACKCCGYKAEFIKADSDDYLDLLCGSCQDQYQRDLVNQFKQFCADNEGL